jgi:hypothetical protein
MANEKLAIAGIHSEPLTEWCTRHKQVFSEQDGLAVRSKQLAFHNKDGVRPPYSAGQERVAAPFACRFTDSQGLPGSR